MQQIHFSKGNARLEPAERKRRVYLRWPTFGIVSMLILAVLLLSACDSTSSTATVGPMGNNGKDCNKVGLLLPETESSVRWETKDHPLLEQAIKAAIPDVHIDYNNADFTNAASSTDTQYSQAQTDLANGDCILVVGAHDSVAAGAIVTLAKKQHVPVIAYDRLIQSQDLSYYVSFDNVEVGKLQGEYIAAHYKEYEKVASTTKTWQGTTNTYSPANIMLISGSQTDNNALLFSQGTHIALDPLFSSGELVSAQEIFTPDWDNNVAEAEAEATLAKSQNDIQIAYVANDGMAGGVIAALKAAGLNGKVLVTGQDATVDGLHAILTGDQNMTVYKPIAKETEAVGKLLKALHDGSDVSSLINGVTSTYNGGNIPSILATPIAVQKDNIVSTIIVDHYLSTSEAAQMCEGIPPGTAGVC